MKYRLTKRNVLKRVLHASHFWQTVIKNYTPRNPAGNSLRQSNAQPQSDRWLLSDQHALWNWGEGVLLCGGESQAIWI